MYALNRPVSVGILGLAAALIFCQPAFAAEEAAAKEKTAKKAVDPSGTWRWDYEMGGETVNAVLKLNYDGKKLTGTFKGHMDPVEIADGKVNQDQVSFGFKFEREGREIEVTFEGQIKGDGVDGTIMWETADDSGDFDWSAKRSLKAEDVVGTWKLRIELPDGNVLMPQIKLNLDDKKKLSGEYQAGNPDWEFKVAEIAVKDNRLKFTVSGDINGNSLTAKYNVLPRGQKLAGDIEVDFGGQAGDLPVTGKLEAKKKKKDAAKKEEK